VPVQIKIESAVVQQAQARLRQQSGAMRAVAVNVSSVLNGLDMQIAATQQIRQSLEALSRRCTTEQTQLEAMTQMLLAASDRFTQTDQKLGHRARGLGEAADAIGAGLAATTLENHPFFLLTTACLTPSHRVSEVRRPNVFPSSSAHFCLEYGKGAVKIGKSIVKIAGAVAACSTVAGIPVALCIITSAGNDIASASADIVHVARDEYLRWWGKQIT